ncbi:MAG: response regulator [Bacteroidales bacterium]|nr:response regulator [Bacteroidales bacterium]
MNTTKKILVVDDDIDVINILQTILTNEGYQVVTANGKKEGLEKLNAEKPDLAILDVMMSTHFEGFELAKAIRDTKEFSHIPVVMQTSIYVMETSENDMIKMAHEFRKTISNKELDVLLIQNTVNGEAGIDYIDENKKTIWVPVNGFIKKPVDSKKLLPQIEKLLN